MDLWFKKVPSNQRKEIWSQAIVLLDLQRCFKDIIGLIWLKKRTVENNRPYPRKQERYRKIIETV